MAINDANAQHKNVHGMINFQRNGYHNLLRQGSYLAFRHLGIRYKVFAKLNLCTLYKLFQFVDP